MYSEGSCPTVIPFLLTDIDVRTIKFILLLLGQFKFQAHQPYVRCYPKTGLTQYLICHYQFIHQGARGERTVGVKYLGQEHNSMIPVRLEPRLLHPDFSALTISHHASHK